MMAATLADFSLQCEEKKFEEETMRQTVVKYFPIKSDDNFVKFEEKLLEPKFRLATVSI